MSGVFRYIAVGFLLTLATPSRAIAAEPVTNTSFDCLEDRCAVVCISERDKPAAISISGALSVQMQTYSNGIVIFTVYLGSGKKQTLITTARTAFCHIFNHK